MKSLISILAIGAAALGTAGTASAQASPQSVTVGGSAPAICTLPTSYSFVSGNAGATGSQFSFQVWNIPQSALVNSTGMPVSGAGYAIRVRGTGFCNSAHTISVQSARGGLAQGNQGAAAPAGFANRRAMTYQAYWSNGAPGGSAAPVGPAAVLSATTVPGAQNTVDYVVSDALPPPGTRPFDVVMSLQRPPLGTPLVAGYYWDTLTVTLSPGS